MTVTNLSTPAERRGTAALETLEQLAQAREGLGNVIPVAVMRVVERGFRPEDVSAIAEAVGLMGAAFAALDRILE